MRKTVDNIHDASDQLRKDHHDKGIDDQEHKKHRKNYTDPAYCFPALFLKSFASFFKNRENNLPLQKINNRG